jgi:hypothetical protein
VRSEVIARACADILDIVSKPKIEDKSISAKIKNILEELWEKCLEIVEATSPRNQQLAVLSSLETSMLRESVVSSGAGKKQ